MYDGKAYSYRFILKGYTSYLFAYFNGNAQVQEQICFALSDDTRHFLIDGGGGNRILKVLKDTKIDIADIHDIFVTHEHVDHILGIVWLIRIIGQRMNQGKYNGDLHIYCHKELSEKIQAIANMTIQQKVCKHMGGRIKFDIIENGSERKILDCPVTFFDIGSTKAKQFGFVMELPDGQKLTVFFPNPSREMREGFLSFLHSFCPFFLFLSKTGILT